MSTRLWMPRAGDKFTDDTGLVSRSWFQWLREVWAQFNRTDEAQNIIATRVFGRRD